MPRTSFIKEEKRAKTTPKNDQVEISEEVEETSVVKEPEVKKKKEFEQTSGILCRSVCSGVLFIAGPKTGMLYQFADYDDETEIEYRDLAAMVRTKDKNVYEPRIIIEDDDFLAEFPAVEKFYADQFTTRDIKAILAMDGAAMENEIKRLPKGALENLKSIAAFQVANGYIDSRKKIKELNEILGIDLDLIGELMSD